MNKVFLCGNLGQDPKHYNLESGHTVTKFSVATKTFISKDKSKTEWHNIVCWGKLGDACATSLKKGSKVLIEGQIEYSQYQNKEGATIYQTSINASSVQFLDRKEKKEDAPKIAAVDKEVDYLNNDIPF